MHHKEVSLHSLKSLENGLYGYASKLLAAGWSEPDQLYTVTYQELYQMELSPSDLRNINLILVPELDVGYSARSLFSNLGASPRTSEMSFALNCRLVA